MEHVLKGRELWLALEGRYTNLRIWTGRDENGRHPITDYDTIYMRVDKAREYSATWDGDTHRRLNKPTKVTLALSAFGFKTPIEYLKEILTITLPLKHRLHRDIVEW